ncbi:LOW QUALITY PROTEIN: putative gustatory receptor 22a [Drosophila eugracilis]|uniref:LOW QUALITY PROTEIN: putative gustatory receptor 22a n=1 Tax=Drosophila eugracilis TaxID=29029 RepID=UPI001BDAAB50|nr:LOW QUALITY PROTEIN: putative gustatory receptor 22a [Drosophila eugracilis]
MLQPKREHRYRQSLAQFTLKATLYGSWVLGLFPFTFDSKKRQLTRSKWLLVYGLILNLTLMVLSVLPDTDDHNSIKVEVFERNPLVKQIETLVEIISMIATLVTHLRTFWKSRELVVILNELLMLENRHFKKLILGDCHLFDRYVIEKGLVIICELASSFLIYFGIPDGRVVYYEAFCIYIVQLEVLLVVMHFHLAVIFIYRFLWIINGQLLSMASALRRGERVDPKRIQRLLWLYGRLLDLNTRLADIYDIQVILFLATLLSANIIVGHVLVICWININRFSLIVMILLFPQALVINFWDIWLGIATCDLAETTSRKTSTILKLFNDVEGMDKELEQRLTEFTLFCSHHRLTTCHLGLFDINYEMGFHMIITNILYVLFLVQFDYMNLKFKTDD